MGILDALAWLDNKRRVFANNAVGLLTDGGDTARQLAAQTGEDLSGQARGLLNASNVMHDPNATPEQKRAAFNDMLPGLLGMVTVYHGTPHTFERYDLSKIGTGEGAQAYGPGMYFAESPDVAGAYRNALGRFEVKLPSGEIVQGTRQGTPRDEAISMLEMAQMSNAGKADPFSYAQRVLREWTPSNYEAISAELDNLRKAGATVGKGGTVYQQDLPDEVLPRMLQWDKPLSEQPEVLSALSGDARQWGAQSPGWRNAPPGLYEQAMQSPTRTGEWLYQETLGAPEQRAAALRSLGIPGLSYLDAGSRGAGNGTLNHVIWDQELLNRMIPQPMP